MSDKPIISKDQRVERIKQSDIKVQINTITSRDITNMIVILKIVLFDKPLNR